MFLLGLLLMGCAAAFVGLLIAYNLSGGPDYTVTLFGSQPFTISTLGAFLGGVALALIFGIGLWLFLGGTVLARHRHKKQRFAQRDAAQAAAERDAMARRLHNGGNEGNGGVTRDDYTPAERRPSAAGTRHSHRLHMPGH